MKMRAPVSFLAASLVVGAACNATARRAGPLLIASARSSARTPAARKPGRPAPVKPAPKARRKLIAYYFHGNFRCTSCRNIEAWTADTIRRNFGKDVEAGRLEWRVVNTDQKGNEHYTKDYKLFTQSVVLSDTKNGKETRWKNLVRVWPLVGDEVALREYIRTEVSAYLKGA